jgi:hypothetical protein
MYIQRRQTLINAVRPLAHNKPAVFFYTYLRSSVFQSRSFALAKQLRTSIAKRVSKFNLDGMDDEEEGRNKRG